MFQMGGIGPMFGQLGYFHTFAGKEIEDPRPKERYRAEAERLLKVLDGALAGQGLDRGRLFHRRHRHRALAARRCAISTRRPTSPVGTSLKHVPAYLDRFLARPAVQRGLVAAAATRLKPRSVRQGRGCRRAAQPVVDRAAKAPSRAPGQRRCVRPARPADRPRAGSWNSRAAASTRSPVVGQGQRALAPAPKPTRTSPGRASVASSRTARLGRVMRGKLPRRGRLAAHRRQAKRLAQRRLQRLDRQTAGAQAAPGPGRPARWSIPPPRRRPRHPAPRRSGPTARPAHAPPVSG